MYGARPSQSLSIGSAHNTVTTAKLTDFPPFFVVAAAEYPNILTKIWEDL